MNDVVLVVNAAIPLALTYALIALAWVIIFRTSGVLNFATGTFVVLGGYMFYAFQQAGWFGFVGSLVFALVASVVISVGMYRLFVARLANRPQWAAVILTLGLSILLGRLITIIWGAQPRYPTLPFGPKTYELFGGLEVSRTTLLAIAAVIIVFGTTIVVMNRSNIGVRMRAVAENPGLSGVSGVNVRLTTSVAWAIAVVSAGIAGILYATSNSLTSESVDLGLRGIAPAFVGGLTSVGGALAGGLIVAVVETTAVLLFGGSARDPAAWALILAFLLVRPNGIFGRTETGRA